MATDLLEKWSSLKEVFRIPKKVGFTQFFYYLVSLKNPAQDNDQLRDKKSDECDDDNRRKRRRDSKWDSIEGYPLLTK